MQTKVKQADMSTDSQASTKMMIKIYLDRCITLQEYNYARTVSMCSKIHFNPLWNLHRIPHFDHHVLFRHVSSLFSGFKVPQDDFMRFLHSYNVLSVEAMKDYKPHLHEIIMTYVEEKYFLPQKKWDFWETNDMCNVQHTWLGDIDHKALDPSEYDLSVDKVFDNFVQHMLYKKFIFQYLQSKHGNNIKKINNMLNENGNLSEDGINFRASVIKELPRIRVERAQFDKIPEQLNQYIIPIVRICSKLQKPETVRRSQRSRKRKREDDFE